LKQPEAAVAVKHDNTCGVYCEVLYSMACLFTKPFLSRAAWLQQTKFSLYFTQPKEQ